MVKKFRKEHGDGILHVPFVCTFPSSVRPPHPQNAKVSLEETCFGKEGKAEPVMPQISQETLAEMIGTTRSRVSFFLNKFRKLGFIDYNGELRVHSSLLNVVLHD
jgi:CRP-like cAMP-binding protein